MRSEDLRHRVRVAGVQVGQLGQPLRGARRAQGSQGGGRTGDVGEPDFVDVLAMLAAADLIIVEGYKTAPIAKIEARRAASAKDKPLASSDANVIAIATDIPSAHGDAVPVFQLDDVTALADFIAERMGIATAPRGSQNDR